MACISPWPFIGLSTYIVWRDGTSKPVSHISLTITTLNGSFPTPMVIIPANLSSTVRATFTALLTDQRETATMGRCSNSYHDSQGRSRSLREYEKIQRLAIELGQLAQLHYIYPSLT